MATSPIYNWPEPDNTDLVKNGALAIRTLGDAIDTTMATMVPKTIVDAKGDLIAGTAADTAARLAVGNNGETLVADSSTSTGLRYQQPKTFNTVINGNFDCWQRGASFAGLTTYAYTADRWKVVLSGTSLNATLSQDSSVPNVRSKYSAKLTQLTSTATTVGEFGFHQIFETSNILPLCGNTVTLSFWYKSSMTGTHYYRIYTAYQTGGVDTTSTFTVTAADTWEYKTITLSAFAAITAIASAPTAAGTELQIGAAIYGGATRSVTANGYVQISQVQMEVGSVATVFARAGGTIQGELAACQRYYEKSYDVTTNPATSTFNGIYWASGSAASATTSYLNTALRFAVTKRNVPSITFYDAVGNANQCTRSTLGVGDNNAQAVTAGQIGNTGANVYSTGTSNTTFMFHYVASSEL